MQRSAEEEHRLDVQQEGERHQREQPEELARAERESWEESPQQGDELPDAGRLLQMMDGQAEWHAPQRLLQAQRPAQRGHKVIPS